MRASIGHKIFGIAFVVTLVMTAISLFNLQTANRTSEHIDRVIERYLASYGAISQLNIHSLQQAVQLRNFILLSSKKNSEPTDLTAYKERIEQLSELFKKEMSTIRDLIDKELGESTFSEVTTLARIDERLKEIENQQQIYEERIARILASIESGHEINASTLAEHSTWRERFSRYINDTNSMMFTAAKVAGEHAIQEQERIGTISLVLLALTSFLAAVASIFLSRQLAHPVKRLLEGTQSVADGNLELRIPVTTSDEIGRLTNAFNQMVEGLTHGKQARETFGQYVDPRIVRTLIDCPDFADLKGERRMMTIMFCDLKGFTNISESLTPIGLVNLINRYCTLMSESVRHHEGVIDKFIGDAVMAYWGAPFCPDEDQASFALLSVISQIEKIQQLTAELPNLLHLRQNLPKVDIRIGVATGEVLVGNIGSDLMRSFTVMGDAVNLASRLESANKMYGTRTLISEETARQAGEVFAFREIDSLQVVGQTRAIRVFELLGKSDNLEPELAGLREHYELGLAAYRNQRWSEAKTEFQQALEAVPDDKPSQIFIERIRQLESSPLAESWDGTWIMRTK